MIKVLYQGLLFSFTFLGLSLFPKKMTTHDHRIFWSQPLRIVLPKTSPAHAALEDLKEDLFYSPPQSQNQKQVVKQLAAGESHAAELLSYRSVVERKTQLVRSVKLDALVVREFKAQTVHVAQAQVQSQPLPEVLPAVQESFVSSRSDTPTKIQGRVELKDGLAVWDPNMQLKIKQIIDGQTVAETTAGTMDGQFVLPTQASGGMIVAELVNAQNQVYGSGTISVPAGKRSAVLPILPSQQGLQTRIVSANSHSGQSFAIDRGLVSLLGTPGSMKAEHNVFYNEPMIENGSNVLMQVSGDKHNTTLAMAVAGKPWDIAVLPKSMSKAMLNLALDEQDRYGADDLGMVWGKVTKNGEPVKNVRVQISDGVDAIYFNELYLPDKHLDGTSENGLFAFAKLNSGIKSIRIFQNDKVIAAEVMPVDIQHVSQLIFELGEEKTLRISPHSYGFMEKPPALFAQALGFEEEKDIGPDGGGWTLPRSNHPIWFEFFSGPDYEKTRQLVQANQENVDVPVFKRSWVDEILKKNGIQRQPYSSTVIGFGPSSAFTVESAGGQILYLTRDRQATAQGVANGAFIIVNLKSDLQVINVVDQQTGLRWVQTVFAEPDITNVLIHPRAE